MTEFKMESTQTCKGEKDEKYHVTKWLASY